MNFGDLKTTNCTEKESSISQKEPLINSSISLCSREDYSNRDKFLSFINSKNPAFFENFDLLEYLNSGSSGCVYSGKFKGKNKKSVAIKFFISKKHKYKENKKTDNNIHEINLSRKLHHKNVTEMFGYYQSPEINYSILEYGKYGDIEFFLRKLLKKHFLSETILNFFSFQILQSLQYIHKCKIVHMDIKPGNILINSNLEAKITDFSISCSYAKFQQNDIVKFPCVGTGNKVDLYSFGVTLYYLFYADFPYKLREIECKDYKELFNNIKKEELIFPEKRKISNYLKDFLTKILERDLSKRININQALNHPWIQGAKIISDEKENTSCQESFMIRLITDNIPKFNDFVNLKI